VGKQRTVFPEDWENKAQNTRFIDRYAATPSTTSCGQFARLLQPSGEGAFAVRDLPASSEIGVDVVACEQCGSPARVGHDYCLGCILRQGLLEFGSQNGSWDDVLDEVNVRSANWSIGNYQILQEIGRGGMGVVYRARHRNSQRIVALKRILSVHADSREARARFRREAATVATLRHPNILPTYEVSETEDGLPFFTMKYAAGGTLLQAARALRHDPRQVICLMAKLTRAVQHAHQKGVLHRDLKPGNILLDENGEPLVSDFGLAKSLDTPSGLTQSLTSFGTPGFIAPEQAQGPAKDLTPAADIYSIGAILFYLLTGRPPFVGENALAVLKQVSDNPAPKLRTFEPELDRDLEVICAKCLEREPEARYLSVAGLAEDLERWLEGRAILARHVPATVRIWRWSKRNPKLAGALATSLALAVLNLVAALTISHLLSMVNCVRLLHPAVATVQFADLHELTSALDPITEARNPFATTEGNIDAPEGFADDAAAEVPSTN
jgi:tRNA A-37 threonylcarbamoyl transferase component Bud32